METRRYFGCRIGQRLDANSVVFFAFYARVKDIVAWIGIRRAVEKAEGTQRIWRKTRSTGVTRFMEADPINTIPNNILVAFPPEAKTEFVSVEAELQGCIQLDDLKNACGPRMDWGFLQFEFDPDVPEAERPALIVDGQHRLYGLVELEEDVPVLVVALLNASAEEQAFQFIVINNKAVKVPTENVIGIIADFNDQQLLPRLKKAGVSYGDMPLLSVLTEISDDAASPFQGLIDWTYDKEGKKIVPLTAIEQALTELQNTFLFLRDDEDSLFEIFCAIWRGVKNTYAELWGQKNKLMTKVSINALNTYLGDRLSYAWQLGFLDDIFDVDKVEDNVKAMLKLVPIDFWKAQWSIRVQDNANVRSVIAADLDTLTSNVKLKKLWYDGLVLPVLGNVEQVEPKEGQVESGNNTTSEK